MYFVYILRSIRTGRYDVGHTDDLDYRLQTHNAGQVKSTRAGVPWERVYSEEHPASGSAMAREVQIKSWKSRKSIAQLLSAPK